MQVSEETEAEGVESAVGICRSVVKQRQKWLKVLSVSSVSSWNNLVIDTVMADSSSSCVISIFLTNDLPGGMSAIWIIFVADGSNLV